MTAHSPRLLKLLARLVQWALRLLLGIALMLVLAMVALHSWIVPRIDDFRPQVQSLLSQALHVPVRIAQLRADGGSGLVPAFAAIGVQILQPDGHVGLSLDQVHVALSVRSLMRLRTEQIAIHAPQLMIRRTADGSITVAGVPVQMAANGDAASGIDWMFNQREIVLTGGSVVWDDQQRALPPVAFSDVRLLLRNPGLRHDWQISLRPPAHWGDLLELRGRFRQPLWALHSGQWQHWSGQLYAQAERLNVAAIAPYLPPTFSVRQGQGSARLWVDVVRGQATNGTADVALRDVHVRHWAAIDAEKNNKENNSSAYQISAKNHQNGSFKADNAPENILLLRTVQGRIGGHADAQGFALFTQKLAVESASGQHWPGGNVQLNHVYAQGTTLSETEVQAAQLDIASLAELAWDLPIPEAMRQWLASNQPSGLIRQASARWRGDTPLAHDWSAKADVAQLAWGMPSTAISSKTPRDTQGGLALAPQAARWGLRGLDAVLQASTSGGQASLRFTDGTLYLPTVFEQPLLPLAQASTNLQWSVQGDQIRVSADQLSFSNADAAGQLRWLWHTADPHTSSAQSRFPGILQMKGVLQRADGTQVHRYLPLLIPADARHYVRDAIQAGQASNVQFELAGDLHDMPFRQPGSGVFRITAPVRDVRYAYMPDSHLEAGEKPWPVLSKLSGELVFDGPGLQIKKTTGILDDNDRIRVEHATAYIADFDESRVIVDAQARGPLPDMLATVKRSAINALTDHALQQAHASGDAQLNLKLDLPVHHMDKAKVQGSVRLAGNRIHFHPDAPVVQQVFGVVQFSEKSFALQDVQGQALGGTVKLSGGMDMSTLPQGAAYDSAIDVHADGSATAEGLQQASELGPIAHLASLAQGQARYQIRIGIAHGHAQVAVNSNMQGMAWRLPAPFNKPAAELWPIHFANTLSNDANPLREQIALDIAGRAQLRYVREWQGRGDLATAKLIQGAIHLGAGTAQLPAKGVTLEADLATVNVPEWQQVLQALQALQPNQTPALPAKPQDITTPAAAPDIAQDYMPERWDIRIGALQARGIDMQKLHLRGARSGSRWTSQINSSLMDGELEYVQENGGPGTVRARLEQLRIGSDGSIDSKALDEGSADDKQPSELPALDVLVDDFLWHKRSVGHLTLQAINRSEAGKSWWHLSQMVLKNDAAVLQASGDWGAATGPSTQGVRRTQLDMQLDLKDTGALLDRLGMPGVISRGKGQMQGRISWAGSPLSPDYTSMFGKLHLDIGRGQFLKAEPGIAKLLGVLSLQALPRRLSLNFRDVFSAGFAFDFVRGDVAVNNGEATTNNLQMKGVTAAVLLEGKANLRDETQDLHVIIIPELNTTTMSLVTTVINPVVGIGSFVAQALLKDKLTQAVTQEFSVTGSWSEPDVQRIHRTRTPEAESSTRSPSE